MMKAMMLISGLFIAMCGSAFSQNPTETIMQPADPSRVDMRGFVGEKIDLCISERINKQDVEHLIEPFWHRNESWAWQSEFWGKWMLSAVGAYKYTGDEELFLVMENSVHALIATQDDNGYIGNYPPENQLTAWDIWGRKYSMLGLIRYYEVSGDRSALKAAVRVADHLLSQLGPDKTNIIETGNYRGMASSSVLEPMVYLYKHTADKAYLDFALYIVAQWETEAGPGLINKAIDQIPVSQRFPHPEKWWSWENGQKAYEMMSCYDGLLQLYQLTGNPDYLQAVELTVANIIQTEINVAGSGSAFECWYSGVENQTRPTYHNMETCVTTTWMKLCFELLKVTGNAIYADQVELSFYNALLGSMKYDASEIAKYTPLEGRRQAGEEQCGMHINCCNANGPRGFVQMPEFSFTRGAEEIYVNLYGEMSARLDLDRKTSVLITQQSAYPEENRIQLTIDPDRATEFGLALRIPAWSKENELYVNGQAIEGILPGSYKIIHRKWEIGDRVELILDLRGRLVENKGHQAILRGPVLLSRDQRFEDGYVDEGAIILSDSGFVALRPLVEKLPNTWMAFSAPLIVGSDLEGTFGQPRQISFCDFSSAGNTWEASDRYRVWIRKTLNVMKADYEAY